METKDMLKKSRTDKGMSLGRLSDITGIPKATLQRYETGATKKIPLDAIAVIEKALALPSGFLMGWEDDSSNLSYEKYGLRPLQTKKFRMLGNIACGQPIYADEDFETYIEASSNINADFCLTAKGDSMINARIFDGDIVFIKAQDDVQNGEIAAVVIGDEITLKRVYKYENRLELRPENPTHSVQNYEGEQLSQIRILGKAVAFQSYVR